MGYYRTVSVQIKIFLNFIWHVPPRAPVATPLLQLHLHILLYIYLFYLSNVLYSNAICLFLYMLFQSDEPFGVSDSKF